jgi:hypothetical protein
MAATDQAATRQENRWFWSIYVVAPARGHVKTDCPSGDAGRGKRQFVEVRKAFKAWRPS